MEEAGEEYRGWSHLLVMSKFNTHRDQYRLALTLTSLLPQDAGGLLLDLLFLMGEEPLTVASPSAQCKMASRHGSLAVLQTHGS